jgi:hypothetical protein
MNSEQTTGAPEQDEPEEQQQEQQPSQPQPGSDFDGLKDKKPDELTPEELRLMADTMPGEGPGD